jgi:hypothetical protein
VTPLGACVSSLACAGLLVSCIGHATMSATLPVLQGSTSEQRIRLARAIVTADRQIRLVRSLRQEFPEMPTEQLSSLVVRIQVQRTISGRNGEAVLILVSLDDGPHDPVPALDYCLGVLERELMEETRATAKSRSTNG